VLNRPNYRAPRNGSEARINNVDFGRITGAVDGSNRTFQLGGRLTF